MPDPLPATTERTVVVQRHGALTYISLGFNALLLLLILIGMHHHGTPPPRPDRDGKDRMEAFDHRENRFDRGDDRFDHGDGRFGRGNFGGQHREWKHRDFGDRDGARCGMVDERGPRGFDGGRGWGGPGEFAAPQPPSAEAMTDRFMLALTGKLALTDPESAQIRPIVQQDIAQFQKDMEAQKTAHQKMIDDAKTRIRAVLTPDQQKQFDAMAADFGGPPPAPGK